MKLLMERLLREAGEWLLVRNSVEIHTKQGWNDFVTDYDLRVQDHLYRQLHAQFPEASFFMEESQSNELSGGLVFCIDPIDGTSNFIRDRAASVISVGVLQNRKPVAGFIYDPYRKLLYHAESGKGAYCNGAPIHVSHQPLEHAIVAVGASPAHRKLAEQSMQIAHRLFMQAADIRRTGSAALDLCDIAAGRSDIYFELRLMPWDYCAGVLLVQEAGGQAINPGGTLNFDGPNAIFAANQECFEPALRILHEVIAQEGD